MGRWIRKDGKKVYSVRYEFAATELPRAVSSYFHLINPYGIFHVEDLPENVKEKLTNASLIDEPLGRLSIMSINDDPHLDPEYIKELLVDVIKSGALFKEPLFPETRKKLINQYIS